MSVYYEHLKNGYSTFKYLRKAFHSIFQMTKTDDWILHILGGVHPVVQNVKDEGAYEIYGKEKILDSWKCGFLGIKN